MLDGTAKIVWWGIPAIAAIATAIAESYYQSWSFGVWLLIVGLVFVVFLYATAIVFSFLLSDNMLTQAVLYEITCAGIKNVPRWRIHSGAEPNYEIVSAEPAGVASATRITSNGDYCLDYLLPISGASIKEVRFTGIFTAEIRRTLYIQIQIIDPTGKTQDGRFFNIVSGDRVPDKVAQHPEFHVYANPNELSAGWKSVTIDVRKAFDQSFAERGYSFGGVRGIRLRGEMTIAKIDFLGLPVD